MKTHLFLTGEKHIGKSTAIRRFLQEQPILVDGICTIRTDKVFDGKYSVHIVRACSGEVPSMENLLFLRKGTEPAKAAERFDRLGCAILQSLQSPDMILLDEIGPNESRALQFQREVFRLLDEDTPVLGVIQAAESDFLRRVCMHARVEILNVSFANRDHIPEQIQNWYLQVSGSGLA